MTLAAFLPAVIGWTIWIAHVCVIAGWAVVRTLLGALFPALPLAAILGLLVTLFSAPAQAGWFWGPDPKVEAANQVLERAAQIATEAAQAQSGQQTQLLAAIEALSSERTQLAGHLGRLGEMATRDSAWAAALQAAGPLLVAVVVLAMGCIALWMVTRTGAHDSQLASVLVHEICTGQPDAPGLPPSEATSAYERIDIYSLSRPDRPLELPPATPQIEEEGELPF
jgi:hypothetical protein